jgi:hypothetical protein
LLVARIAWACDINAKEGWKYPDYDYTKGFNVQPNWFPFKLKAREGREYLVEQVHEKIWGTRGFEVFSTPPLQLNADTSPYFYHRVLSPCPIAEGYNNKN